MPPRKGLSKSGSKQRASLSHSCGRLGFPSAPVESPPMTAQLEQHLAFPARLTSSASSSSKRGTLAAVVTVPASAPTTTTSTSSFSMSSSATSGSSGAAPPPGLPSDSSSSTHGGAAFVEAGDGGLHHTSSSSSSAVSPLSRRLSYGDDSLPYGLTNRSNNNSAPELTSTPAAEDEGGGSTAGPGHKRPRSNSVMTSVRDDGAQEEERAATTLLSSAHLTPSEAMALTSFRSFQLLRTTKLLSSPNNNSSYSSVVSGAANQLITSLHGLLQRWGAARRQLFTLLLSPSSNTTGGLSSSSPRNHQNHSSSQHYSSSSLKQGRQFFTHHRSYRRQSGNKNGIDEDMKRESFEGATMNVCDTALGSFLTTECVAVLSDPSFGLLTAGAWLQPPTKSDPLTNHTATTSVPDAASYAGLGTTLGFMIGQLLNTAFVSSSVLSSGGCTTQPHDPFLCIPNMHPSGSSTSSTISINRKHHQPKKSATTAVEDTNSNPVLAACCHLLEKTVFVALREHELQFSGDTDTENSPKRQRAAACFCYWNSRSIMPVLPAFMVSFFNSIESTFNNNSASYFSTNNSITLQQRASYLTQFKDVLAAHMCNTLLQAFTTTTAAVSLTAPREFVLITPLDNTKRTGFDGGGHDDVENEIGGIDRAPIVQEEITLLDLSHQQQANDGTRYMKSSGLFETTASQFRRDVLSNMYGGCPSSPRSYSSVDPTACTATYDHSGSGGNVDHTTSYSGANPEESAVTTGGDDIGAENRVSVMVRYCVEVIRNCSSIRGKMKVKLPLPLSTTLQQPQPGAATTTTTSRKSAVMELLRHVTHCRSTPRDHQFSTSTTSRVLRRISAKSPLLNKKTSPKNGVSAALFSSTSSSVTPSVSAEEQRQQQQLQKRETYNIAPQYALVESFRVPLLDGGDVAAIEQLA